MLLSEADRRRLDALERRLDELAAENAALRLAGGTDRVKVAGRGVFYAEDLARLTGWHPETVIRNVRSAGMALRLAGVPRNSRLLIPTSEVRRVWPTLYASAVEGAVVE